MESEAAAALAAAVVVEAAAATVETAAVVGEAAAAAAEEEEGEAAAAKGKRTALPGLGGIPNPGSPLSSPHPPFIWKGLCRLARPLRGVRFFLSLFLPPPPSFPSGEAEREAPQVLQTGRGWEASGPAWAPGKKCVGGGGDSLESGAGESPGWGRVPGAERAPACTGAPGPPLWHVWDMGGLGGGGTEISSGGAVARGGMT